LLVRKARSAVDQRGCPNAHTATVSIADGLHRLRAGARVGPTEASSTAAILP
jgi:hypothetical protein